MATQRRYKPGDVILRENELGETAYLIEEGRVEVTKEIDGRRVQLAHLTAGQIVGEMSLVDEKPRSATVTAITETVVQEIHRDTFLEDLRTTHKVLFIFLRVLLERLREADSLIAQLQRAGAQITPTPDSSAPETALPAEAVVLLEGLTHQAVRVLPSNPFPITKFPFLIGRQSVSLAVPSDLPIPDQSPLQISLHHLAFIKDGGRIGVVDQGSILGSQVDGQRVGGVGGHPGPVFFRAPESTLILGNEDSQYQFKVIIRAEGEVPCSS